MTVTHSFSPGYATLRFSDKPPEKIRSLLRANGMRWSPSSGVWWRSRVIGMADLIQQVQKMLDGTAEQEMSDGFDMMYEDACRDACGL